MKKVALIVKNKYHQEPNQFIMKQNTLRPVAEMLRMRNRRYSWVEPENLDLIDKLSQAMRANHTALNMTANIFSSQRNCEFSVEWAVEPNGKNNNPQLRFKVLFFKN